MDFNELYKHVIEPVLERLDKHGADLRVMNDKIDSKTTAVIETMHKIYKDDIAPMKERVVKLESERSTLREVIRTIVAIFGGTIAGWWTSHK